jgi:hypothetical protein
MEEFVLLKDPPPHAYNDPSLSATEFLLAVMHATHLPMSTRLEAAKALLPFTNPYPRPTNSVPPRCTIVIPPFEPRTPHHGSADHGPSPDPTRNHSQNLVSPNIPVTHNLEAGDPVNLTTIPSPLNIETPSNTPFVPDYSTPPDPAVFAAARKWGLPEPHLCSFCGHWLTTTYPDCICADRDPSKLN